MKIQIEPVTVAFEVEANYVELRQGGYILGTNEECRVRVLFFRDSDLVYDQKVVIIPEELVAVWTDDQPLIDYVIDELSLVKIESNLEVDL